MESERPTVVETQSPWQVYFRTRERRARLAAEVMQHRAKAAVALSRPLTVTDMRNVPSQERIAATTLVERWIDGLVDPLKDGETDTSTFALITAREKRDITFSAWFTVAGLNKTKHVASLCPPTSPLIASEVEELFKRLANPSEEESPAVLAPVFVWLLSRAAVELYPGFSDDEARSYARDEVAGDTRIGYDSFARALLVLIEPWCCTIEDGLEVIQKVVVAQCLAPTYGTMPASVPPPSRRDEQLSKSTGGAGSPTAKSHNYHLPPVLGSSSPKAASPVFGRSSSLVANRTRLSRSQSNVSLNSPLSATGSGKYSAVIVSPLQDRRKTYSGEPSSPTPGLSNTGSTPTQHANADLSGSLRRVQLAPVARKASVVRQPTLSKKQ